MSNTEASILDGAVRLAETLEVAWWLQRAATATPNDKTTTAACNSAHDLS